MAKLIFKNEKLRGLLDQAETATKNDLWLVKDEGIYLMVPLKKGQSKGKRHICYAEGYEPDLPDCFDKCQAAVGGDDFVESFDFSLTLQNGIRNGADIMVEISEMSFTVALVTKS